MTTATEEQVDESTTEQLADEDAGFQSVVENPTDSEEGTPEIPDVSPPATEEEAPSPDVVEETAKHVEDDQPAKISDKEFQRLMKSATDVDEMKAALDKRFDTLAGKLGGLERHFSEQKKTGTGKFQLTREHFPELFDKEDGFELFGEKVLVGLNRGLEGLHVGGSGLSKEEVKQAFVDFQKETALGQIADEHEDFQTIVGTGFAQDTPDDKVTEYWRWVRSKGAPYYKKMYESNNPAVIVKSLSDFKEFKAKPPAEVKPKGPSPRERQLRAGVQMRSAGGPSVGGGATDEETAMREAAAEERKELNLT